MLRVKYGFCQSNNRHFPSSSAKRQCARHAVQIIKKKNHLVLRKALAIASAFRLMGLAGLGSNAKVEFELYPTFERKER